MDGHLQIILTTKLDQFSVPDFTHTLSKNIGVDELNSLVNKLLADSCDSEKWSNVDFDFIIDNELLRTTLEQHLEQRNVSTEKVVEIEYIEKYPSPTPANSLTHNDWVSCVHASKEWILSGSYDCYVYMWSIKGLEKKLSLESHEGPVKALQWIHSNAAEPTFITCSQDQYAKIWKYSPETNSAYCTYICKGHERSCDCLDINPTTTRFATGSWDAKLKIWSLADEDEGNGEQARKKSRHDDTIGSQTKTPIVTLDGHREAISAVQWIDDNIISTASWDHTIKIWDLDVGAVKDQLVGNKAFFASSYSPLSKVIITASADTHVRLWDPRGKGNVVKCVYSSHSGWVNCVKWSSQNEYHFISGSQDKLLKQWDTRSPTAPLYDMSGHAGKIMCCDWSNSELIVSGGDDHQLKVFSARS